MGNAVMMGLLRLKAEQNRTVQKQHKT